MWGFINSVHQVIDDLVFEEEGLAPHRENQAAIQEFERNLAAFNANRSGDLHAYVRDNCVWGIQRMVALGVSVDMFDPQGYTPLQRACMNGAKLETVRVLLSLGALLLIPDGVTGYVPSRLAQAYGHQELAEFLFIEEAKIGYKQNDIAINIDMPWQQSQLEIPEIMQPTLLALWHITRAPTPDIIAQDTPSPPMSNAAAQNDQFKPK